MARQSSGFYRTCAYNRGRLVRTSLLEFCLPFSRLIELSAGIIRTGFVVLQVLMLLFCYRLIFREEAELRAAQGEQYDAFKKAVPRLCPALTPRIAAAGGKANWAAGFRAEGWCWGFALAVALFAITLKMKVFGIALAVSLGFFFAVAFGPRKD